MDKPTIHQTPAHPNNYDVGRAGTKITQVTFHHIVGTGASVQSAWENPNRNGSSTYSVGEDGKIRQHVAEGNTPWTDGNIDSNRRAITIEHADGRNIPVPYPEAMYRSAAQLLAYILDRHGPLSFKRHREVSNKATACPGKLDVERIIREAKQLLEVDMPLTADDLKAIQAIVEEEVTKQRKRTEQLYNFTASGGGPAGNATLNSLRELIKASSGGTADPEAKALLQEIRGFFRP